MVVRSLFILLMLSAASVLYSYDYKAIDAHVKTIPASYAVSVKSIGAYIMQKAVGDKEKARGAYIWVVHNIRYDYDALMGYLYSRDSLNEGLYDPKTILKTRKAVCGGYSRLYQALCKEMGLECLVVLGWMKNTGAFYGEKIDDRAFGDNPNHAWNAVKIDGKWELLDATVGNSWGNYRDPATGRTYYNPPMFDYFFMTPPEKFVQTHYPEDPAWLLTDEKISRKDFEESLYLFPGYFLHHIMAVKPLQYSVNTKDDSHSLVLKNCPRDKQTVAVIYYGALYQNGKPQTKYQISMFEQSADGDWTAEIPLPKKGDYYVLVTVAYLEDNVQRSDLSLMVRIKRE